MAKNLPVSLSSNGFLKGSFLRVALGAIACFGLVVSLQMPRLQQILSAKDAPDLVKIKQELAAEEVRLQLWRKMPSFGFDNLLAGWVFLQFNQYFGDIPTRDQTGSSLSPKYFEVIVNRDPKFLGAYIPLSTSISLYAAQPEKSIALMDQGLKSMQPQSPPRSYIIWRLKAIDQLLFLGDGIGAKQSFLTSAAWANSNPDQESKELAALSQQTAQFLEKNPKSKNAQVIAWSMILSTVPDERTKKIAKERLESLGAKFVTNPDGSTGIISPPGD